MTTRCWLEINRGDFMERRNVRSDGEVGVAAGACPGCQAEPFQIRGGNMRELSRDTYISNGRCVACNDAVGYIYARVSTIFGIREDMEVGLRARVY